MRLAFVVQKAMLLSPAGGSNYYYYGACAVGCVAVGGVAYFCLKPSKKSDKSEENLKSTSTSTPSTAPSTPTSSGSTWELPKTVKITGLTDETGSAAADAWGRLNKSGWRSSEEYDKDNNYYTVPGVVPDTSLVTLLVPKYGSLIRTEAYFNVGNPCQPSEPRSLVNMAGAQAILDFLNAVKTMSERGECDVLGFTSSAGLLTVNSTPHHFYFEFGPAARWGYWYFSNIADVYTDINKAGAKMMGYAKSAESIYRLWVIYRHNTKEWQVWKS